MSEVDAQIHGGHGHGGAFEGDISPYAAHQTDDDEEASVGDDSLEDLHEKQILPVADAHGDQLHYPGEEKHHKPKERDEAAAEKSHSVLGSGLESIKYLYSTILLVFCVVTVMATIFDDQTKGTAEYGLPPIVAFIIFWFLLCWLAMMEGGQGALVGLQPIDKSLYADSHPRALMNTSIAHKGDNMERFIVGRQFLVVFVVFATNMMGSAIKDAKVLGFSDVMAEIFLGSGVAMILTTLMVGQLTAQVNAANCMLDFINNYFMLFTTYVSLAVESSGLLHSVYLVQIFFSKISGKPIETKEPPRSALANGVFWLKVLISCALLGFAFAVTLSALFKGQTGMWAGVPEGVSVVVLFILMIFVGLMEGMQIALFACVNMPEDELKHHTMAHKVCQLTFSGQNLQAFLIGRQIAVTCCMFIVARITSVDVDIDAGEENIFGVSDGIQEFFNTGLLGAVITTIVASLAWRIIASSFPVAFLSNPLIYLIVRFCLMLEKSGLCSAAWVLARYHKPAVGYQPDEVHLEGATPHTGAAVTRRDKDIDRLITILKFTYSLGLLAFAVLVVMASIFEEQSKGTADYSIPSIVAFLVFWFLICWLAMMEGGQGALVGLQPVDKEQYRESHPRTFSNTTAAHKGDNMERFIVGRQFLVVFVVFAINMMGSAIKDASVLGLPDILNEIFLASGLGIILTTLMVGQLTAQVNAANCMLDFLNNYFMLYFVNYVSLAVETSGLLHSVYLVQIFFSKISGKPIDTKEPPRSALGNVVFWSKVLISCALLAYAFAVTLAALFQGKTGMWAGVPEAVSVVILFILMAFVGMMEGMQIALFACVNMPEEELKNHPIAYANCQLTFADQNLQAFLIGRQICVTCCMFIVARITSVDVDIDAGEGNIFGVSDGVQEFFNTGLLGAVITTIVGSLAWRIIASSFPVAFLSNPLIYLIIRLCLILETSGLCSAAWILGRWNKVFVGYQPDEVYLENAPRHTNVPVTRRDKDIDITITVIKYLYSTVLLVFSVVVVMSAIFDKQTKVASEVSPYLAFVMIWFLLIWLGMMEGGQGCLVGLQPVDKQLYCESHPVSHKSTKLGHKGDNMERFIVGRQFLVVLVVFATNQCGGAIKDAQTLGLSDLMTEIFLGSGVAMIMTTLVIGQLTAQVNAANCMLDFINTYFMVFTTNVSLAIEASGLLHCVYLVQIFFSKITGTPIATKEPPRSGVANVIFWTKVTVSLALLGFSFAVTLSALFKGKTTMWDGIPEVVSVIVLFVLMAFVGMMEGMQIALFACVNMPESELQNHSMAQKVCKLTFSGTNLQAFCIGRQICVTVCMFVVARITTLDVDVDAGDDTIFGVSKGVQEFFNTGLLGALITTVVASLAWRVIASSFPIAFLSNPLIYLIVRLTLVLEASGLCSSSWLLALIHKEVAGFQLDETYIGTAEEREAAAKDQEDLALEEGADSLEATD
jgi:Silicon transporter